MKITNKLKTNTSGFGHIEMLLLVVAVVVIGGVGFFVYQNQNKKTASKSTAHAGGWTKVEKGRYCTNSKCTTSIGFNSFACYDNSTTPHTDNVRALINLDSATPWLTGSSSDTTNTEIWSLSKKNINSAGAINWGRYEFGNWSDGLFHATLQYPVDPSVNNFIVANPWGPSNGGGGLTGSTKNVTYFWVIATKLAPCF